MLVFLPESDGDLACVKIIGKLTAEDYQSLMDIFYGILNCHGALRLYANLEEFDGWEWVNYWYPIESVVSFKRNVYRHALTEFAPANVRFEKLEQNRR